MARASDKTPASEHDELIDVETDVVVDELEGDDALADEAERAELQAALARRDEAEDDDADAPARPAKTKKSSAPSKSGRSGNPAKRAQTARAPKSSNPHRALLRSGNPAKRGRPGEAPLRPATAADWIAAGRPRTLSTSIAAVALGSAAAYSAQGFHLGIAITCLFIAVFMQIGVNYANDYSDGVRGTDRGRVGPQRLTASRRVEPKLVRETAFLYFALAGVAGIVLTVFTQIWWLPLVGLVCFAAAWFYTGGKRPYGYFGLGELVAFVFFGPVAVLGTQYAMIGEFTEDGMIVAAAAGCFAAALMLVNNMRDRESDKLARKHTLATLLGPVGGRVLYVLLLLVPYGILFIFALGLEYGPWVYFSLLAGGPALIVTMMARDERDWNASLGLTSLTGLLYGVGLAVALWGGVVGFRF